MRHQASKLDLNKTSSSKKEKGSKSISSLYFVCYLIIVHRSATPLCFQYFVLNHNQSSAFMRSIQRILSVCLIANSILRDFGCDSRASLLVVAFVKPTTRPRRQCRRQGLRREICLTTMNVHGVFESSSQAGDFMESSQTVSNYGASPLLLASTPTTPLELGSLVFKIQRVGENIFAAMFFIAFAQACVALIQYRTNPRGQLIVPPGATVGTVEPTKTHSANDDNSNDNSNQLEEKPSTLSSLLSLDLDDDDGEPNDGTSTTPTTSKTLSTAVSRYSRILNRFNRWLVVLLPWTSQKLAWFLRRNTHLFHFGFIISLASLFDVPNRWFASLQQQEEQQHLAEIPEKKNNTTTTSALDTKQTMERIIVIGDSLAVGLGSSPIFDAARNSSVPFARIENLSVDSTDDTVSGPVFPRALAETLANHYQTRVHWRSAGVDGGDVGRIQDFCLGVIKEEVDEGRVPDAVVVLCGINDLKYFVSNPFRAPGPRIFRQRLTRLLREIQDVAPDTNIILPMFPTQMFRANSPLNIFPLNFFLDAVVGYWDSMKKLVVDRYPSDKILYCGLPPAQIYDWYQKQDRDDSDSTTDRALWEEGLIAPDGIHPNAQCYGLWAEFVGKQLVRRKVDNSHVL
jgi:lysophospholipase L1-like esterase